MVAGGATMERKLTVVLSLRPWTMSSALCKGAGEAARGKLASLSMNTTNRSLSGSASFVGKDMGVWGIWPFYAEPLRLFLALSFCSDELKRVCGDAVISEDLSGRRPHLSTGIKGIISRC